MVQMAFFRWQFQDSKAKSREIAFKGLIPFEGSLRTLVSVVIAISTRLFLEEKHFFS